MPEERKKPSLAKSAALMGVIILISKVMGLFRDILVASHFGTTEAAIAYETASKLPLTIFDFILGGVVTSAFIPVYNSIAVKKDKKEALSFAQSYLNLMLVITGVLSIIGVVFAPLLVSFIAPKLSAETALMAAGLTRIMFPMVIFVSMAFTFVGYLQSEGEYNIPAVISLVSNIIMVLYLLTLSDRFGVKGLSVAMLAGWFAQAAVQLPAVLKRGFRFNFRAALNTPEIKRAAINTVPILIATWTTPVCNLINTRIASGIENGRAITALGYANKLYIIIVGLFSFVATNLLFPYFAKAAASGRQGESDRLTRTSVKILVFIVAPIAVGVAVLSSQFITLVYQYGSFNADDTLITSAAMRSYAVGMVFAAVGEVLTKAFFAVEKTKIPMISSIISMAVNIILIFSLKNVLSTGGIALIAAVATAINMTINLLFAYRHGLISKSGSDWLDIGKTLLSSLIMGAAVWYISTLTSGCGKIVSFAIPVLGGVIIYVMATLLLRSEETTALFSKLTKKQVKEESND